MLLASLTLSTPRNLNLRFLPSPVINSRRTNSEFSEETPSMSLLLSMCSSKYLDNGRSLTSPFKPEVLVIVAIG